MMIEIIGRGQQYELIKDRVPHIKGGENYYHIAVGDPKARKNICEQELPPNYRLWDVYSGHGASIYPMRAHYRGVNSYIAHNATIGHCVYVNTGAIIEHDCVIGDYVNINPGAILCGAVEVGECTEIGAGAVIRQGLKIGSNCVIGMGAVVTKDVPDNETWVGNPARPLTKFS